MDAKALKQELEVKAREFAADPKKGRAAGYSPEHKYIRSNTIGSDERVKVRSDFAAWLYGVARRDLTGRQWRIDEAIGGAAWLVIFDT